MSIMIAGGGAMSAPGLVVPESGLVTTITKAVQEVFDSVHAPNVTAHGFDAGADGWFYAGTFGSIADDEYQDGGDNTRTVTSCYWVDFTTRLWFVLDTTSVPDTDTTFVSITVDGTTYNRSDAETYDASVDGGTSWKWGPQSNDFAGANPIDFTVTV